MGEIWRTLSQVKSVGAGSKTCCMASQCFVVLCCVDRKSFAIRALNSMKALHGVSKQAFKRCSHQ